MRLAQILPWTARPAPSPSTFDRFTIDPDYVTAPMPKILWIELTSKCPFDCIFCTRKSRFGAGRNLDFAIYQRLIDELESPDFIGLNYSGESIYYPRLLEAIRLAVGTGALTEVVTAFSTVSKPLLEGIVDSGLDRLAVSLHTMDPRQYQDIYQFGSLDLLQQRVNDFLEFKATRGLQKPRLDFCFVAMHENIDQLSKVVEYARSVGVQEISVHPIIGRHLVPHDFSRELAGNNLRDGFKKTLRQSVAAVKAAHPGFAVNVLNPDIDPHPRLSHAPTYFAPPLPQEARLFSCDQSPFESMHVLASGQVVVCEVLDEIPLGDLRQQSLRDIWHSEAYRTFRRKYVTDPSSQCRNCVWKLAYLPSDWTSSIAVRDGMSAQLLRGWHAHEGADLIWSRKHALLALSNPEGRKWIRVVGTLPHAPGGHGNSVTVTCNRSPVGELRNDSTEFLSFDQKFAIFPEAPFLHVGFSTEHVFRPSLQGASTDARDLGLALRRIEVL
ncbi:MAG: radical SAM protein [Acidobacteriia bacterium]|nr:radical SAM protein [Terriglobia bacterium]